MYCVYFQIGPGFVYLDFDSFFGRGIFIEVLTPVEPMVQKLVHNIYMHWAIPNFITKFYINGLAIQVINISFHNIYMHWAIPNFITKFYINGLAIQVITISKADPDPPKNHKNIGFLSNSGPDPLKNYKATKPTFSVGPSSARQRNAI